MQRRTRNAVAAIAASTALAVTAFGTAYAQDPTTTTIDTTTTVVDGPQAINAKLTGTLKSNGSEIELPQGSALVGELDETAGTFTGDFSIPDISTDTTASGFDVRVVLRIESMEPVEGSISDDGSVAATAKASVRIVSLTLSPDTSPTPIDIGESCYLRPINLSLTGQFDAEARTISLSQTGFVIPAAPAGSCGAVGPIDIAEQLNGNLAGSETSLALTVELGAAPEAPVTTTTMAVTTTTAAPVTAPAATPATPATGNANFTG